MKVIYGSEYNIEISTEKTWPMTIAKGVNWK